MIFASITSAILNTIFLLVGIFLILLVLIQRGRGGGLAGALGGVGGSSPFGSRAGDMFTKITMVAAGVWIVLAIVQIYANRPEKPSDAPTQISAPAEEL